MADRLILLGNQDKAAMLSRRAVKEMNTLRHAMSFNNLIQGCRRVPMSCGGQIVIKAHGAHNTIQILGTDISSPESLPTTPEKQYPTCWCSCCMTSARVTEVLGDGTLDGTDKEVILANLTAFFDLGKYDFEETPTTALPDPAVLRTFTGTRYRIEPCLIQKDGNTEYLDIKGEYICTASDWRRYYPGDTVMVAIMCKWVVDEYGGQEIGAPSTCRACKSTGCFEGGVGGLDDTEEEDGEVVTIDGAFMIIPVRVEGVTNWTEYWE